MYNSELYHHGVKDQKWGVRRYQNPDGSLTDEGRKHYATLPSDENASIKKYAFSKIKKTTEKISAKKGKAVVKVAKKTTEDKNENKNKKDSKEKESIEKKFKSMSDEELNNALTEKRKEEDRKKKETELISYYSPKSNPTTKKGKTQVQQKLESAALKSLETVSTALFTYAGKQAVKEVFGEAKYKEIFPKKKD